MSLATEPDDADQEASWVLEDDGLSSVNDNTSTNLFEESGTLKYSQHEGLKKRLHHVPRASTQPDASSLIMPLASSSVRQSHPRSDHRRKHLIRTDHVTAKMLGRRDAQITQGRAARAMDSTNNSVTRYLHLLWSQGSISIIRLTISALSLAFTILKPILTLSLAIWMLYYLTQVLLISNLSKRLTPICWIPGISYLCPSICPVDSVRRSSTFTDFDQLMTVQSAFEDVLSTSSTGLNLPIDMKRSEASIRDLKHLVQYSALPSRNELVFEFAGFIETARLAASDLTRFNSHVGRSVDKVISTNRWTLQVLDGLSEHQNIQGLVNRIFSKIVLNPFKQMQLTEDILLEQYLKHTRSIEEHLLELIVEAQALLSILQNLDDRLDVIHGITSRDGISIKDDRDELFAQLWTKLGGNKSSKKKYDEQLILLGQVSSYRRIAWEHVSATVLKLQAIAAGLENLRDSVAVPDIVGYTQDTPLKLHIDNIQMALQRLDHQRSAAKRFEGEQQRQILDKTKPLMLPS